MCVVHRRGCGAGYGGCVDGVEGAGASPSYGMLCRDYCPLLSLIVALDINKSNLSAGSEAELFSPNSQNEWLKAPDLHFW